MGVAIFPTALITQCELHSGTATRFFLVSPAWLRQCDSACLPLGKIFLSEKFVPLTFRAKTGLFRQRGIRFFLRVDHEQILANVAEGQLRQLG